MKKILTIDDSAMVRSSIKMTLEGTSEFIVEEATDGQTGLDMAVSADYDLILCDINMPVLDGIGFLEQFRANAPQKRTPVLILTTETEAAKIEAAKKLGATGWITKPFDRTKLVNTIKKVVR